MITVTIDGHEVEVAPGTLILDAAKQVGVDIPVFCYHPRMSPVAACRMCLVRVDKMPKLQPACATPVAEGMVVHTDTPEVDKAHQGVLEFLLANHPLDCPICDKGGECDLQDNSIRYGPNATRFSDQKRHLDKKRPLGPLVELDQERCIQCLRCVRFMDEVAGDPVLTLHDRGGHTTVDVAEGRTFDSIFSGNTIELCPVGALTSRPYRFHARPWDLDQVESVCPHCPVGCNIKLSLRLGEVQRILSRDNESIDRGWLCDRGRFGYGFLAHGERLARPLIADGGAQREVAWDEAVRIFSERFQGRVGLIGGGRQSLEADFLMGRLAEQLGTQNLDHRVGPMLAAVPPTSIGRIADIDDADLVIAVDSELLEEAPVIALRLRQFHQAHGLRILSVSSRRHLIDMPHEERVTDDVAGFLAALARGEGKDGQDFLAAQKVLFIWNGTGRANHAALQAAAAARGGETHTLVVGGLSNSFGAEATGLLPGSLDTRGMLEAAARGELDALLIAGHDLLSEYPDRALVERAISGVPFLVVTGSAVSETSHRAHLVLPVAAWAEAEGHLVNMEGRAQPYYAGATRVPGLPDDWELFQRILGDQRTYEELLAEVQGSLPALFAGERAQGRAELPSGGYVPSDDMPLPSIYFKGVTPEPFAVTLQKAPTTVAREAD